MKIRKFGVFAYGSLLLTTVVSAQVAAPGNKIEQARPWLGIAIEDGKVGVLIKDIIPDTPAAQADLKAGDEVTAISGTKVVKPSELMAAVLALGVGNIAKVEYLRGGKAESKDIKLVARPDDLELMRAKILGKMAPPFSFETIAGHDSGTRDKLKGKTVVLEFWATWCSACRSTHARLSEYAKTAKRKGIAVIAVSDEEAGTLKAYVTAVKPKFTVLRANDHDLHDQWMVSAIPMLVVLDKTGMVKFATIGAGSDLEEALAFADKLAAAQ